MLYYRSLLICTNKEFMMRMVPYLERIVQTFIEPLCGLNVPKEHG